MWGKNIEKRTNKALLKVLENRKNISDLLDYKTENIVLKNIERSTKKAIESSIWNELGIYFLTNNMFMDAENVYRHMLETIARAEKEKGVIIHKGLPLHNIGVAQINMKNYDEGIPNILKAYDEDVDTYGKTKATTSLASQVKAGLLSFVSKVVDGNYLKWFNDNSGSSLTDTFSLMGNMDETEKLYFVKAVNSKKLISFHDDVYTRNAMLDNLRDLALLLESNLKRRCGQNIHLSASIMTLFHEEWTTNFVANKNLKDYDNNRAVASFQENLVAIRKLIIRGNAGTDFLTKSFLTIALVRNFAAHFVVENLDILKNEAEYDAIFAMEIAAILYSLNYSIVIT